MCYYFSLFVPPILLSGGFSTVSLEINTSSIGPKALAIDTFIAFHSITRVLFAKPGGSLH